MQYPYCRYVNGVPFAKFYGMVTLFGPERRFPYISYMVGDVCYLLYSKLVHNEKRHSNSSLSGPNLAKRTTKVVHLCANFVYLICKTNLEK